MNGPARGVGPSFRSALLFLALLCLPPDRAAAHGVYIFAWADGQRLCTRSYFSKSSRVMGGDVGMRDSLGKLLDSGQSDEAGLLCFAPPREARDLVFTVNAGQGHRGEFLLPAAEVALAVEARAQAGPAASGPAALGAAAASADPDARPYASSASSAPGGPVPKASSSAPGPLAARALSPAAREEVLELIRSELGPLRQDLAERRHDAAPGPRDILGGLGWIFGLAGLGALCYVRKSGKR